MRTGGLQLHKHDFESKKAHGVSFLLYTVLNEQNQSMLLDVKVLVTLEARGVTGTRGPSGSFSLWVIIKKVCLLCKFCAFSTFSLSCTPMNCAVYYVGCISMENVCNAPECRPPPPVAPLIMVICDNPLCALTPWSPYNELPPPFYQKTGCLSHI